MGGSKTGRSSSGVAPMVGNGGEHARLGKHEQSRTAPAPLQASTSGRRFAPTRGWLMLFLLVNLFAIATFTFFSAVYFPSASTSGIMKHINNQGDVSLLELPKRTEGTRGEEETPAPVNDDKLKTTDDGNNVQTSLVEKKPRLRSENDPTLEEEDGITAAVGDLDTHDPPEAVVRTSKIHPVSFPVGTTPTAPATTPEPATSAAPTVPAEGISQLLKEMKGTRQPTTESPLVTTTAAVELEQPHDGLEIPSEDEGFEKYLALWLKADEGVEVESPSECEALGSACDVKVWKSAVTDQSQHPILFEPVSTAMRPVLQPMAQNNLPLVSFSCGLAHSSGLVVHDMMTLFFVLSPSRIEPGDTYRAQKFFGNSPYGQFLFHGGKPAFFTTGGLRESDFVASNHELVLVTYRLHRHAVEIKINGHQWSPQGDEDEAFLVRMSGNAALSLGNVKSACDTNAFQGLIAEVMIYDAVLSNRRVSEVEKYLLNKWWGDDAPTAPSIELTAVTATQPVEKKNEAIPEPTTQPLVEDPVTSTVVLNPNGDEMIREDVQPTSPATEPPTDKDDEPTAEKVEEPLVQTEADKGGGEEDVPGQDKVDDEVNKPEAEADAESYPRTFDPEGVFEWLPPADLLSAMTKHKGIDTTSRVDQWKKTVREKVDTVRNFQLGGEVLRSFIRERRDELLMVRAELFGIPLS